QAPTAGVERLVGRIPTGVVLTNARGVYATAMAEYVMWAVLQAAQGAAARRSLHHARRWPDDAMAVLGRRLLCLPTLTTRLRGLTMLVAGYGGVGREVARLAKAIGMRVMAIKARPEVTRYDGFLVAGTGDPEGVIPERILGVDGLAEAAGTADFLVLTMPATSRNRGIVGPEVLAALPAGAWVVNVGRGTVLDQPALVEALRSGHLGGAVLDVFDQEPLSRRSPLWKLPNVVLTPHVSGADALGRTELAALVCANLRHYVAGAAMLNLVDLGTEY